MSTVVRWVVTLSLLGLLVAVVDLGAAFDVLVSARPAWVLLALLVALGDRLLMAGKWVPLLRIQLPGISVARAVKAYWASTFAAFFLPASVGGDVLRTIGIGRDRDAVMEVGASVAFERVLGLIGSGMVALFALWVAFRAGVPTGFLVPWALLSVGVGVGAAILPFSTRARDALRGVLKRFPDNKWTGLVTRFGAAYRVYRGHPGALFLVGVLSAAEQLVPVGVFWLAAIALDLPVTLQALVVAAPLTVFAARLPISIAGLGVVEGGMVYLLGLFGVPSHHALSIALIGRVVEILAILPGSYWWRELLGNRDRVAALGSEAPPAPTTRPS